MPARDGTGPRGEGPMTGRGLGPCNPYPYEGDEPYIQMYGRPRYGLRSGFGRGRRGGFSRRP